jgi:ribosomal protein S4E
MYDGMIAHIHPSAAKWKVGTRAGHHSKNIAVPLNHLLETVGADIDVIKSLQRHAGNL